MAGMQNNPMYNMKKIFGSLLSYVREHATQGDAASVIAALDKFAWDENWMMFIGDSKGDHLMAAVDELGTNARVLELGTFTGYGAIRMAMHLKEGSHIFSMDVDPECLATAKQLIEFAGVSSRITLMLGAAAEVVPKLCKGVERPQFDLIFIDHHKDFYLSDTRLLCKLGGVGEGTVLFADNVICPGTPAYLKWVRAAFKNSKLIPAELEYTKKGGKWTKFGKEKDGILEDGLEVTVCTAEEVASDVALQEQEAQGTEAEQQASSTMDASADAASATEAAGAATHKGSTSAPTDDGDGAPQHE